MLNTTQSKNQVHEMVPLGSGMSYKVVRVLFQSLLFKSNHIPVAKTNTVCLPGACHALSRNCRIAGPIHGEVQTLPGGFYFYFFTVTVLVAVRIK